LPVQLITIVFLDFAAVMLPGILLAVGVPMAAMELSVIRPLRICTLLRYIGWRSPSRSASNNAVAFSDQRRSTPHTHMKSLFDKLGVHTRAEAVAGFFEK
jgi:hypothetical protein